MKLKSTLALLSLGAAVAAFAAPDLSAYKTPDPAKNLLKNGGFETVAKKYLPNWGRLSANVIQDREVKYSGAASLKIGGVPQSYASASFHLGAIADLKNDLLIRGRCKYEGIDGAKGSQCFIGIWTTTAAGKNSRTFAMVKVPEGSGDWFPFEEVLRVDALKAACAKVKPEPVSCTFRVNIYKQPGWIWLDDVEIIPLEKK